MRPTIALLPSPLLGPVAWQPVAEALRATGSPTVVVDLHAAGSADEVLEAFVSGLPRCRDLVLVPHSNAGLYAAAVAAVRRPLATVFVDAALPSAAGETALAPPQFYEFLSGMVDEHGLLPPWTQWWDESDLDGLFPSEEWRRRVEDQQPRLPLSYFRSTVQVPAGWDQEPAAYLAFGETYAAELEQARGAGWPVKVLDGGHLHMLHDPTGVGSSIGGLLGVVHDRPPARAGGRRPSHGTSTG